MNHDMNYLSIPALALLMFAILVPIIDNTTGYNCDDDREGKVDTHEILFDQAVQILRNDGYVKISDFLQGTDAVWGKSYLNTMKRGSADNDITTVWNGSINHFMHPVNHAKYDGFWEILMDSSYNAAQMCSALFADARVTWGGGSTPAEKSDAMYNLGWAAHMVQDLCTPHHSFGSGGGVVYSAHTSYEDWVSDHEEDYLVDSGGIYYSDLPQATTVYQPAHFESGPAKFVDFNAHESLEYYLYVNDGFWEFDDDNYELETVHDIPNDLDTTWNVTYHNSEYIQIEFDRIAMNQGDHLYIYNETYDLKKDYTDLDQENVDTGEIPGEILRLRLVTDATNPSWGYRTKKVSINGEYGDEYGLTTAALLPRAQRTTAGFIEYFFEMIDKGPPEAPILEGHGCGGEWSNDPAPYVTWNESRDDSPLGIERYECRFGENGSWQVCTSPIDISQENDTVLYVRAVDAVHKTNTSSIPIRIDRTKPNNPTGTENTSHSVTDWSSDNTLEITWSGAFDALSGIGGYGYNWDNGMVQPDTTVGPDANTCNITSPMLSDGEWHLNVRAVDAAGNWAEGFFSMGPFRIDATPPGDPAPDDNTEGWSSEDEPLFTWSAPGDLSGIAGYHCRIDDLDWKMIASTSLTLPPQADGRHTFHIKARDRAGNEGVTGTHDFLIDVEAPILNITTPVDGQWLANDSVEVNWTSSDNHSGLHHCEVRLDNGSYVDTDTSMSKRFSELPEGTHRVYMKAVDGAGNSDEGSIDFNVDTEPPIHLSLGFEDSLIETSTLSVNLVVSGDDETSGLLDMSFSNDGIIWSDWENWSLYKRDWDLSGFGGNGNYGEKNVYLRGRDRVGNIAVTEAAVEFVRPYDRILISPIDVKMRSGDTQQFSVFAYDKDDKEIPGETLDIKWKVEGSVGTVDEEGLFTARKAARGEITGVITVTLTIDGVEKNLSTVITVRGTTEKEDSLMEGSKGTVCLFVFIGIIFLVMAYIAYVVFRKRHRRNGSDEDLSSVAAHIHDGSDGISEDTSEGEVEGKQKDMAEGGGTAHDKKDASLFYEIWEEYNLPILEPVGRYLPPEDVLLLPPLDNKMGQNSDTNVHTLITEIIEQWEEDAPKAMGEDMNRKAIPAGKREKVHSQGKRRGKTRKGTDEDPMPLLKPE